MAANVNTNVLSPVILLAFAIMCASAASPASYWWRYRSVDCGYDDIQGNCTGSSVTECETLCDTTAGCGGFNYPHGILKKTDCISKMAPSSVDLYIKRSIPQPLPDLPKWGLVWPAPQSSSWTHGGEILLAADFSVTTKSTSAALQRGITRYEKYIETPSRSSFVSATQMTLSNLVVVVDSTDESLNSRTNYSYTLSVTPTSATVTAATVYGALYGMETFSQLVVNGTINGSNIMIADWPQYHYRGFMADTGRRFWPVDTVMSLLDAMSFNKMNVLHLHLSDNCRFAINLPQFPQLTADLTGIMGGFYSVADVHAIVAYAKDRGIRVIPEADLPGHSQGFKGLSGQGLEFCATNGTYAFSDLRDDAAGMTIKTLKAVYSALSELFPDEELFIGADETANNGPCTITDYEHIETEMCDHITVDLGKIVGGWEEYAFETKVAKANPSYTVNSWHYHTQFESTAHGFPTVASNDSHFYLLYGQPYSSYWVDIASGMNTSQIALLKGGSVAAWGDEYCHIAYCIHPGQYPSAHNLFPPSADALFRESIIGYSFPRAAVAAASFWNFLPSFDATSDSFGRTYDAMNARMIARGVPSCPNNCGCNAASRCGKPYTPEADTATKVLDLKHLSLLEGSRLPPQ